MAPSLTTPDRSGTVAEYRSAMTSFQSKLWFIGAIVSFGMALASVVLTAHNHRLQSVLTAQQAEYNHLQEEVRRGALSEQYLRGIVEDLRAAAPGNPKIEEMLVRHGWLLKKTSATHGP